MSDNTIQLAGLPALTYLNVDCEGLDNPGSTLPDHSHLPFADSSHVLMGDSRDLLVAEVMMARPESAVYVSKLKQAFSEWSPPLFPGRPRHPKCGCFGR